ncbi:pre-peptidase C-terminal domain-containing protein [Gottfriedia luciferensis]|uniref:pre-peptidase C-terminal domain-containing protein n=1 Tax=Gottfriedia luciferensis TaxID=178774 RepID=UPI000B4503F9|nr:pre-peptidase C-terminal domain-containing protein [Gottfriedia luciferensis]
MKKLLSYLTAFVIALAAFAGFAKVGFAEMNSEVEKNDTIQTATPINFSPTNDLIYTFSNDSQGTFEDKTDVDYYKFILAKNGAIKVNLSQLSTANIAIALYNDKNEELQSEILTDGRNSVEAFNEGLKAGTYYLKVYVYEGTITDTTNSYHLGISGLSNDYYEKESNDSPTTATPLTLNKYYTGYTDADADDIFKFNTTTKGKITVRGTYSPNVELNYLLVDSKYNVVEDWTLEADPEADDSVYNIFSVGVKPGTYYLVVTHDYENDEDYNEFYRTQVNFTADNYSELELNDTASTATPINLKTTYNGIMSWKDDVDTYKVSLPVNANITLNMSQAPSTIFKATIVDSNNKTVKTVYTKKGKSQAVSLGNVNLVKGTYYVKVQYSSGDFEQVPYKLQVQPKIFWGKVEYKPGMKGKTTAVSSAKIYKLKSGKLYYYKTVVKGTETAVYGIDKYGYNLGGGLYMKKDRTVKYVTVPSSIISSYNAIK